MQGFHFKKKNQAVAEGLETEDSESEKANYKRNQSPSREDQCTDSASNKKKDLQ